MKNLSVAVNATRSFLRERELELKVVFFQQKLSNLGPVLNELVQLKRITKEVWGQIPKPLDDFRDFAGKNSNFNAISIIFYTFLKPYE